MNKSDPNEELTRLISNLLDGSISLEEHTKLSGMLEDSSHNRQIYLDYIRMESLLHWESTNSQDVESKHPLSKPRTLLYFPLWAGAIAATLLAFFGVLWFADDVNHSSVASFEKNIQPNALSMKAPPEVFKDGNSQRILSEKPTVESREYINVAIASLNGKNLPANEGLIEYFDQIKRWNRLPALLMPTEKGILPASGTSMIGLGKMVVDVDSKKAELEETVQVLDVRNLINKTAGEKAKIFAALKVNQSFGNSHEGAEFGITLKAIRANANQAQEELSLTQSKVPVDLDPSTWDELSSEMELPNDTQFVVVSLSARKTGPDSLLANASNYYADDLELYLSIDQDHLIGPI
jgi:hypothetical protein